MQYRVDSGKQALPDGRLFSPELVANGDQEVTNLRDRTSVRNISVALRHAAQTAIYSVTCWADQQESHFRNPESRMNFWFRFSGTGNGKSLDVLRRFCCF